MKLKNKKTGEVKECVVIPIDSNGYPNEYQEFEKGDSLAELNEEWEDAPEGPKEYWFINPYGVVEVRTEEEQLAVADRHKQFGNYFETREEAEKAVEKLKAWKRLKDGGFVFCGKGDCLDTIKFDYGPAGYNNQDFNLLFGGEE